MKTRELPKWAIVHWVKNKNDEDVLLIFEKMDWAYWLFITPDGVKLNFNADFEERNGEYWIA